MKELLQRYGATSQRDGSCLRIYVLHEDAEELLEVDGVGWAAQVPSDRPGQTCIATYA